jgi:phosphotransferase system  glucose/maltose/N-acetylglucosamine-specific IIC component
MEIWHIVLICILLVPIFFMANYFVVRKMVAARKEREDRIERAVAKSVADSFSKNGMGRYESWPKYRARMRKKR